MRYQGGRHFPGSSAAREATVAPRRWRRAPGVVGALATALIFGACAAPANRPGVTAAAQRAAAGPPVAPVRPVAETLHGVVVNDPYRWLENERDPEAAAWWGAQGAHARAMLDGLGGRARLQARIAELLSTGSGIVDRIETARWLFLVRETEAGLRLTARARDGNGWAAQQRVVFDPVAFAPGEPPTFRANVPSPDGRYVAIGRTSRGDADPVIVIVETETGRVLPDRVGGVLLTSGGSIRPAWHPDGSGFFYPKAVPATDPAQRLFRGRFVFHRLGTDPSTDRAVFGFGLSDAVPMAPEDTPSRMIADSASRWLIGSVWEAAAFGGALYATSLDGAAAGATGWRRIASVEDEVGSPILAADSAYAISTRDASRGRLVRFDLADPRARWEQVLGEQPGVLTSLRPASDALYLTERVGGAMRLLRLPSGGSEVQRVPLPADGTIRLVTVPDLPGATVTVESWLLPPRTYRYDPATGVRDAGIEPHSASAFDGLVAERLAARSSDGVLLPISVVRSRSLRLDGSAPLLLEAYGTFGVSTDPEFLPQLLAWVERGGVYAFAHVRGGGELGRAWHESARRTRKAVSTSDFIAAAEHLVAAGYTTRGRIGVYGVSAGGLLGANAVVDRPDLFGAAIHDVSPFDVVGVARHPSGARNMSEFGWDDTAEGLRATLAVSPYQRLTAGVSYPAVLVHTGAEDYNAGAGLAAKYVAKLQSGTSSGRPVLWLLDREGGHDALLYGGAAAFTDALAFLFWQLGHPDFQPVRGR